MDAVAVVDCSLFLTRHYSILCTTTRFRGDAKIVVNNNLLPLEGRWKAKSESESPSHVRKPSESCSGGSLIGSIKHGTNEVRNLASMGV